MALPGWLSALGKSRGEREKHQTDAALGERSMELASLANTRLDALCDKVDRMQEQQDLQRELLYIHADWDRELVVAAREAGIPVSMPPPLFPAGNPAT